MRYHVRRAASVMVALSVLAGLPLAGGAWLSGGVPVEPDPALPAAPTTSTVPAPSPAEVIPPVGQLAATYSFAPVVTEPAVAGSVTKWICDIEDSNNRCREPKVIPPIPPVTQNVATVADEPAPGAAPASQTLQTDPPRAPSFDRLIPLDPQSAEEWRGLVELFFRPGDVDRAVDVIHCESRGRPDARNPRSTASGLFQHLASMWPERAARAGYGGTDVFDPVANTAVAAWLVYEGGGWRHWNASRHCWG